MIDFDIAVIGAGIAGSAVALAAAGQHRVLLVDEGVGTDDCRPIDVLVPGARELLVDLALLKDVNRMARSVCLGQSYWWGTDQARITDYRFDENGTGWHLDPRALEQRLRRRAVLRGARLLASSRLVSISGGDGGWSLRLQGDGHNVTAQARLLVDATGERSSVARHLGVERRVLDTFELFGLTGVVRDETAWRGFTLTESVRDGWWQCAPLDGLRRRMLTFHTGSGSGSQISAPDLYDRAVSLRGMGPELRRMRFLAAPALIRRQSRCSALRSFAGRAWLAVGDAAATFDPLEGGGLLHGLRSAGCAARACDAHLAGNGLALQDYGEALEAEIARSQADRMAVYGAECRWPESTFWASRQTMERRMNERVAA